jgi:ribosomal protein S19
MRLAVRVHSADPVFLTVVVHFQVVGHLLAAFAVTQHGRVQRMVKLEKFHAQDFTVTEYTAQAKPSRS